ncbi:MAG TPA: glycosyltransferase [Conexibacter sp.]|nr:glycosyltransferase [Conexibacter sp.]
MRLGAVAQASFNGYYRMILPMHAMQQRGHEVMHVVQEIGTPFAWELLADCDLVHIHRPVLIYDDGAAVDQLYEAGAAVGFDEDDNIADAPIGLEDRTGQSWLQRSRRNFDQMLTLAPDVDLVTTPSPHLAARFAAAGAENVHVVDNYLPEAFARVAPRGHEGIVIGWHAGDEHLIDAEALGLETLLRRLLDAHPDVHVVTVNVELNVEHERYHHEETVPFERLTQRLADFDVGIVPLADIPFNLGRSNVKAREYAAAGVPWLASPVGAYRELGEREGGLLVAQDEWFDALSRLIGSSHERAEQAKRAKAWAQRETMEQAAEVWERLFIQTVEDVRAAA